MKNEHRHWRHRAGVGISLLIFTVVISALAVPGSSAQAAERPKHSGFIAISLDSAEGLPASALPASALEDLRAGGVEASWPTIDAADSVAVKLWDEWPQPRRDAPSGSSMSNGSTVTATVTINGIAQ